VLGALLLAVCAGCSGINASHSVSPATFFLPGFFGQSTPAPDAPLTPVSPDAGVDPVAMAATQLPI